MVRSAGNPELRRWLIALAALVICGVAAAASASGPDDPPTEYQVKAAFLFNFAKFVEWPADAFAAGAPLSICVVGEDPFGDNLDALTKGERLNSREIAVRRLKGDDAPRGCHVLFVSGSERRRLRQVLEEVHGGGVLTVSDIDEFARAGGMIRLTKQNYRIGFEINPQAAERARLKISSKLLSLAKIVEGPGPLPGSAP